MDVFVDERFVPESSPRSNAALAKANLLQNEASAAHFAPLFHEASTVETGADLADAEKFEVDVLSAYLPQQMSETDVAAAIDAALAETGAKAMPDMGKVMAILKPKLAGRADMGKVSAQVKSKLSGQLA